MGLQELYQVLDQGNYEAVLLELEHLEGEDRLEGDVVVAIFIFLDTEGDLERAKAITDQVLANSDLTQRIEVLVRTFRVFILSWEANYQEGWRELERARKLFESLEPEEQDRLQHYEAFMCGMAGGLLSIEGNYLQALERMFQAIEIAQQKTFPLKSVIPASYNNIGLVYENLGELDKALSAFERSLAFFQELGNEIYQAIPLGNIGRYYHHWMGDNSRGLDYYQQSLEISQKCGWKRILAHNLHSMGSIHHSKGDYQRALSFYQQSLRLTEGIKLVGWDLGQALPLYKIVLLYLELQELDNAKEYLKLLQEFSQISSGALQHMLSLFAEALFLKNSKRFREKSQAQDLLREIIEDPNSDHGYRLLAMLHLCDLLIQEAKAFEDDTLFREAQLLVNKVVQQAQTKKMIPILVDVFILQSKFALIEGNAQEAYSLLEKAHEIGETKGLAALTAKVKAHQDAVKKELNQWQELAQRNAPLQERLQLANLEGYLQEAIRLREQMSTISS